MSVTAKLKVRRDDVVVVVRGKDRGIVGRVLRVDPVSLRVVVEGVHKVKRHRKGSGEQPGSIVESEASIHVSNVALWDAERSVKVKAAFSVVDGNKIRVDRKTGLPYGRG